MFENIVIPGLYLATFLTLTLVLLDQYKMSRLRRQLAAQSVTIDILRNDVRALYAGSVGEDGRIHRLESRTRRIKERQEQLENSNHAERPYEQAIRMVQKGTSIEDLMSVCNLSKGEADLIMMMHGTDQSGSDNKEQYH